MSAAWTVAIFATSPLAAAPPEGGTIAIQPKTADGDYDPTAPAYTAAAGEALAAKGFTILPDADHAAYVAELILSRADVGTGTAKVSSKGADVAPGMAPGIGAGVSIPLPTGKSRLVALQRITIELRIHKRGETGTVWHAAAVTVREEDTKKGAPDLVAAALSEAVLRSYPAEPEEMVGVP